MLLLRLISDQFIDLHDLNFAMDKPSFKIVEALISRERKIPLCAEMDSRDASSNVLSRRLKKIQRIDNFIFEERGAKDLYVGWPFVRGKFSDGTMVRCPLIFFPVELQKVGVAASVRIHTEKAGIVGIVAVALQWVQTSLDLVI